MKSIISRLARTLLLSAPEGQGVPPRVHERARAPNVLMRPTLSIDGNQWCALYGDDLVMGVAGFGDTPALAMADFDKNWARLRPLRKGTQSRYHRSRGMHHMPAMNHYLSNDKFNQSMSNRLLQAMLERSGVSK